MKTLQYLLLHAVKERGRKVWIEKIWSPLQKFGILGRHWYGRQVEGHATTSSGRPVAPHVSSHVNLSKTVTISCESEKKCVCGM